SASFSVRDALAYEPTKLLGLPGKSFQGDSYYLAPNPPFGAVFTYRLDEGLKTLREARHEREKESEGEVEIPSFDELRLEDQEKDPRVILTVRDASDQVVRRIVGPTSAGFHRVAWDLRWPSPQPVRLTPHTRSNPWDDPPIGPPAVPGTYSVDFESVVRGERRTLGERQTFEVVALGAATLGADDRNAYDAFARRVAELQRAVIGASRSLGEATDRVAYLERAILETPDADPALGEQLRAVEEGLRRVGLALQGDRVVARAQEPRLPSISDRVNRVGVSLWTASSAPTQTQRDQVDVVAELFGPVLEELRRLVEVEVPALETSLEAAGAPWTPGRVPVWP
ncbi:MAG: glycosyl hydrolase, partial [Acidobacteriota bacterium]